MPELDVGELERSLEFYVGVCGFRVLYRRPEESFAYLERGGAELMLQEAGGPGRRFRTASLERPYGRGVNLQIEVSDARRLYEEVLGAGVAALVELELRRYRTGEGEAVNEQFVVADPDGYLLRFFTEPTATPRPG